MEALLCFTAPLYAAGWIPSLGICVGIRWPHGITGLPPVCVSMSGGEHSFKDTARIDCGLLMSTWSIRQESVFLKDKVAAAMLACFKLLAEGNVKSTEVSSKSNSFTCQGQAVAFYFKGKYTRFCLCLTCFDFCQCKVVAVFFWMFWSICTSVPEWGQWNCVLCAQRGQINSVTSSPFLAGKLTSPIGIQQTTLEKFSTCSQFTAFMTRKYLISIGSNLTLSKPIPFGHFNTIHPRQQDFRYNCLPGFNLQSTWDQLNVYILCD